MSGLVDLAVSGVGLALVPGYLCARHLASGALLRVLPEWAGPNLPVSLVTPLAPSSSARLRLLTDAVAAEMKSALDFERR